MTGRAGRLVVALALAALMAAACDDQSGGRPQAGPTASNGATPSGPVIGLLYTVSGQGGEFAQAALGVKGLVEADLQQDGVAVRILEADYGGSAKQAVRAARDLVKQGAIGIVVATDDAEVASRLRGFTDVPLLYALISTDDAVSDNPVAFRVAASNALQARKLAEFLVDERGYQDFAIMHDATAFGREGSRDVERELFDLGADVVMNWEFKNGGDIHTPVMHAGQLRAQALILWATSAPEAGRITIEVQKSTQAYQLVVSGNLATAAYGKNASSQVVPVAFRNGILSAGTWAGPWFDAVPSIGSFFDRFRTEQSALAPVQAAQIYDGLLLLARGAAQAGTPEGLARQIESTKDFEGVGVPLTFSSEDHEGVGMEDMAVWAFTRDQSSAGGDFFPEVDTGGGFFTILPISVTLPEKYSYLLVGLPGRDG